MLRELSLGTLERVTGGSAGGIRGRDWQRLQATIALRLPQLGWHASVLKLLQLQVWATVALDGSRLHVRLEQGPHLQCETTGKWGGEGGGGGGGVIAGAVRCSAMQCGTVRCGVVLDCARTWRRWRHQQNSAKPHTPMRQSSVAPQPAST